MYMYVSIIDAIVSSICIMQTSLFVCLFFQSNLEMLGTLRERQVKLKEDALLLQEQMTEFRNNVVKEVQYNVDFKCWCST